MKEKIKNNLEKKLEPGEIESQLENENLQKRESGLGKIEIEEKEKETQSKKENFKKKIEKIEISEESEETLELKRQKYTEKNLPAYLDIEKTSLVFKAFKFFSKFSLKEVSGKESLPSGEKLFIVNHRGGESGRLVAALDNPIHIVSAETINWSEEGMFKWFLKKIGAIPIKETFSHLSEEQKQEVVKKAPSREKEIHAEATKNIGRGNLKNIKTMVATLLKGEDLAIFTEGPFSRLEEDERKSYAGYALVAREYKRITGEDLNIIPTGIRNSKVSFGKSFHIDKKNRQSKEALEDIATEKIHSLYDSLE